MGGVSEVFTVPYTPLAPLKGGIALRKGNHIGQGGNRIAQFNNIAG